MIEIKEGNVQITFDGKFVKGQTVKKKFFGLLKDIKKFSFPVKHISSIRYKKERPPFSIKMFIFAVILIVAGIFTLGFGVGVVLIALGGWILYVLFKPEEGIYIQASGGDSELIVINNKNNKDKAQELIQQVEENM